MSAQLNKKKYRLRTIVPRPIRIDGNAAYIPLTRGYEAVIDANDVPLVSGMNWQVAVAAKTQYAVSYTRRDGNGKQYAIRLHRIIVGAMIGMFVDHIDHDGLNNRRSNLRVATPQQNMQNKRRVTSKPLSKGVYRSGRRFRARIWFDGRNVALGTYDTESEAHRAFCDAADRLHGKFACHN